MASAGRFGSASGASGFTPSGDKIFTSTGGSDGAANFTISSVKIPTLKGAADWNDWEFKLKNYMYFLDARDWIKHEMHLPVNASAEVSDEFNCQRRFVMLQITSSLSTDIQNKLTADISTHAAKNHDGMLRHHVLKVSRGGLIATIIGFTNIMANNFGSLKGYHNKLVFYGRQLEALAPIPDRWFVAVSRYGVEDVLPAGYLQTMDPRDRESSRSRRRT